MTLTAWINGINNSPCSISREKGYLTIILTLSEGLEVWTVTQMVGGSIPKQEAKHLAGLITCISDIYTIQMVPPCICGDRMK